MRFNRTRLATAALALATFSLTLLPTASHAAPFNWQPPDLSQVFSMSKWSSFLGAPKMPSMDSLPGMPSMGSGGGFPGMPGMQSVPDGFPKEFKTPTNATTNQPASGWGCDSTGKTDGGEVKRVPIIFVHGASRNAHDWDMARQYFLDNGYSPCELWSVTYGSGNMMSMETNDSGSKTLQAFADSVIDYLKTHKNADVNQVDVIAHSLGGTVTRTWLANSGDAAKVHSLITIASPHHGINICQSGTGMGSMGMGSMGGGSGGVCGELTAGGPWLTQLNGKFEAPPGVRTMTIYDGTGKYDMFYPGDLKDSPALEGATNHPYNVENNTQLDHVSLASGTLALQLDWVKNDLVTAK